MTFESLVKIIASDPKTESTTDKRKNDKDDNENAACLPGHSTGRSQTTLQLPPPPIILLNILASNKSTNTQV